MKRLIIYKDAADFVIERVNEFDHATKRFFSSEEGLYEGLQAYMDVLHEYELDIADNLWAKVINFLSSPEKKSRGQVSVLFSLHKKMYDVRWNEATGDSAELEKELMQLGEQNGVHQEVINKMMEQLYIPPYKEELLPDHLKTKAHGGKREGAGRPSMGTTRKISITLPDELWTELESEIDRLKNRGVNTNMSSYFRFLVKQRFGK